MRDEELRRLIANGVLSFQMISRATRKPLDDVPDSVIKADKKESRCSR